MFSFQCHEKYLAASLRHKSVKDQERAYRELGMAHKNLGNLQQALVRKLLHHFYLFVNSQGNFGGHTNQFVRRFGHFPYKSRTAFKLIKRGPSDRMIGNGATCSTNWGKFHRNGKLT